MTALQGELNAAAAAQVALIGEHLGHSYWGHHDGIMTPASFLTWKLGLTPHEAARMLELAVGLEDLPLIREAFGEGRLSLQQVGVLIPLACPETEERLLEYALGLSGAQLVRFASHYRNALRAEQDRAHQERYLSTRHHGDGSWTITGRLSSAQGAVIDKALSAALEEATRESTALDEEADDPFAARTADCLVQLAESFLCGGDGIRKAHERHTVTLHVELGDLLGDEGLARIAGGGITGIKTVGELLAGGASLVEMIHHDGDILSVSDKRRPNTALRRALAARDQHCIFPGCPRTVHLDAHHHHWVSEGGQTSLENLGPLCWSHHPLVHEGVVTIEKTPSGLVFRGRDGAVIERAPVRAGGSGLTAINQDRGIEITPETCLPGWGGEPGDLAYLADLALTYRYHALARAGELELPRWDDDRSGPEPRGGAEPTGGDPPSPYASNDHPPPGGRDGPDP